MSTLVALTANERLLTFDSGKPKPDLGFGRGHGVAPRRGPRRHRPRPATGQLYGVSDATRSTRSTWTRAASEVGGRWRWGSRPAVRRGLQPRGPPPRGQRHDRTCASTPTTARSWTATPASAGIQGDTDLAYAAGDPPRAATPTSSPPPTPTTSSARPPRPCTGSTPTATPWCGQGGLKPARRRPTAASCSPSAPWASTSAAGPASTSPPTAPPTPPSRPTTAGALATGDRST